MTMLDHSLEGRETTTASGISGRFLAYEEKDAKVLKPEFFDKSAAKWEDASKAGSKIPGWMVPEIGKYKEAIPDLQQSGGRKIASEIARDYAFLKQASEARQEGTYVEVKNTNGTTERGIVSGEKGALKREGLWIEKDAENRVREIGTFKNGQPEGTFRQYRENGSIESSSFYVEGVQQRQAYKYNDKSEIIERSEVKDGKVIATAPVDPVKAKEEKAQNQAQWRAMNNVKLAR